MSFFGSKPSVDKISMPLPSVQTLSFLDQDRLMLAILAMFFSLVAGLLLPLRRARGLPVFWILIHGLLGRAVGRLYRTQRSAQSLRLRGLILTLFAIFISLGIGFLARAFAYHFPLYRISEIILLCLILVPGLAWRNIWHLYTTLHKVGAGKGHYYAIARSTHVDLSQMDDYGISRVAIAFAARIFDKGLMAPLFWYVIGGLPAAFLYAGLAALVWISGKDGHSKGFGTYPLIAEKIAGFIPGLLSGVIIALAGILTPGAKMSRAFGGVVKPGSGAPYAEGGMAVNALAYALSLTLGGPVTDLAGNAIPRRWIGPDNATARVHHTHIKRVLYLIGMAYVVTLIFLLGSIWVP